MADESKPESTTDILLELELETAGAKLKSSPPKPSLPQPGVPKPKLSKASAPPPPPRASAPPPPPPKVSAPPPPPKVPPAARPAPPITDTLDVSDLEEIPSVEERIDDTGMMVDSVELQTVELESASIELEPESESIQLDADELSVVVDQEVPAVSGLDSFSESILDAARELVADCEARLGGGIDDRLAASLHHQIGRLYEMPLGDLRSAIHHYQAALRKDGTNATIIQDTRRAQLRKKNYAAALELYDPEIRLVADPREKATLLLEKGLLLQDGLNRGPESRHVLQMAHDLDRSSPTTLQVLGTRFADDQAYRELDLCLEQAANSAAADPAHRAALIAERASLVERALNQKERAIELYETAVRLDPNAPGALSELKRLHHQSARWRDLIRVLALDAELTTDESHKAQLLYRIARLQRERLGNDSEAQVALESAAELAPEDVGILTELSTIHERSGRFDALAETLQRLAQVEKNPRSRLDILHRLGSIQHHRLDNTAHAIHWYEAALAIDPLHGPTLRSLETLFSKAERREDIIRIRMAEAKQSADASLRAAAYSRVGELYEALENVDEAINSHSRALAADARHAASFKALVRLLSQTERYRDLVELRERALLDSKTPAQRIAHLYEVGAVYESRLAEPERAISAYERILKETPGDVRAIASLQRSAESAGKHDTLLSAIDKEINVTKDPERRVALQHRAGQVLEQHLGDTRRAISRYRKVLEDQPKHAPALTDLARLYDAAGRWEDLLNTYAKELALGPAESTRMALLQKMGDLCRNQLGREEEAQGHYRAAFNLDRTHRPSADALLFGLAERREHRAMVDVLAQQAEANEGIEKARLLARAGGVLEDHVKDGSGATSSYERALKVAPGFRPAIDALARLRVASGNHKAYVSDLAQEAALAHEPRTAVDALIRQGEAWADRLNDSKRAAGCFEKVLEISPTHLGALLALERIYRRNADWDALVAIYAAQARVFMDAGARIAALHAEARLRRLRSIGSADELLAVYRRIVELDPEDALAVRAMERLALDDGRPSQIMEAEALAVRRPGPVGSRVAHAVRLGEVQEALGQEDALESFRLALSLQPQNMSATRALSRIASRSKDPELMVTAALQEASVANSPEEASALLLKAADVRAERLGDESGAASDLERALELAPNDTKAAEFLTGLLRKSGEFSRLHGALSKAASEADADRSAALWMQTAVLQEEDLDDRAGAIAVLQRLTRTMPNHVPALTLQARYFCDDGQFSEAVTLYGRIVRLAPDPKTLRNTHLELARLWDDELGDPQRAMVSLQAVLSIDPSNFAGLARLAEIHEREGRMTDATDAAKRLLLAAEPGGAERAAALIRLARLQRAQGLDAAAAEALREAVSIEGPGSESALECKALTKTTAAWSQYASALEKYLQGLQEPDAKTPTYLELGRVLFDQLEQRTRALEVLREGLDITGGAPQIARDLALRLRSTGDHERSVDVLTDLATAAPERAEIWRELATTYEQAGDAASARIVTEPIAVLGRLSESDRERLAKAPPRPFGTRAGTLREDLLDRLGSPTPEQSAAGNLLRVLAPVLTKLYPPEFDSYDLSSRDKLSSGRNAHPFRQLADDVAGVFGVEHFDVYIHEVRSRGLSVELASPPAIIMPAPVLDLPESQQVFLLARPLAHIARGYPATNKLTPRELEVLLASAARNVQSHFGAGLTNEDILDEQAKRIYKALPRRNRKGLEESARAYVEAARVDFTRWVRGAERTAARAAALVCDDLAGVIEVLRRTERDLTGLDAELLLKNSEVVRDLVVFWGCKAAMHLRKHMGLLA